jgi:signal transduction histidine kinase
MTKKSSKLSAYQTPADSFHNFGYILLDARGTIIGADEEEGHSNFHAADEIIGHLLSAFFSPEVTKKGLPEELLALARTKGSAEYSGEIVWKSETFFSGKIKLKAINKDQITAIISSKKEFADLALPNTQSKGGHRFLKQLLGKEAEEEMMRLKLEQQREVLNAILITQEKERERIGEGLHNGIGQLLYAISMKIDSIEVNETNKNILAETSKILNDAIRDVRSLSFQLIPSVLKDFGLPATLGEMINRLSSVKHKISLEIEGLEKRLSEETEFSVYRIIQELLNNCIKHSEATEIVIKLKSLQESVLIEVSDNGKGFVPEQINIQKGMGLQSVSNRVKLLQAKMEISSYPGEGTSVKICM